MPLAFHSFLREKVKCAKISEQKEIFRAFVEAVAAVGIGGKEEPIGCKKLWPLLQEIHALTAKRPKDLQSRNRQIFTLIREGLRTKDYEHIKNDEFHPAVRMLHGLCLASFTEPQLLRAFHEVGSSLAEKLHPEHQKAPFHERLKLMREAGYRHGLIKKIASFKFLLRYFRAHPNTLAGTWLGGKIASFLNISYDPRKHEIDTGMLYENKLPIDKKVVLVRTVYTPSPTIGNELAEMARAVLQAMRNRKKMTKKELLQDPYPYVMWYYTNLQNITSRNEGLRSQAMMKLNQEFSDVFFGMTLPVNSRFYCAGVHGEDEKRIQKAIWDTEPLNQEYMQSQLDELLHEANFTLKNRRANPGGEAYFPAHNDEEKEQWRALINYVVRSAYQIVEKKEKPKELLDEKWIWYHKAAFRELVLLGLILCGQKKAADSIGACGGKMLVTNVCKENIDRGGKTNACLLWAHGGSEEDVLAALYARALLTQKSRLVQPDRLEQMYALTMVVSQQQVGQFLNTVIA